MGTMEATKKRPQRVVRRSRVHSGVSELWKALETENVSARVVYPAKRSGQLPNQG